MTLLYNKAILFGTGSWFTTAPDNSLCGPWIDSYPAKLDRYGIELIDEDVL